MNPIVSYVAHPVGYDPETRAKNLERLVRWVDYLLETYEDRAFVVPWYLYVVLLEETEENRARGIRDDLAVLERCDEIVLCGGVLSAGMSGELDVARCHGLAELNLLSLGPEPPA